MQASELPGGVIRQTRPYDGEKGDCFSACVSMLIGMPLEHIPVLPPTFFYSLIREEGHDYLHIGKVLWTEENAAWKALLADNGYDLDLTNERPQEYPYIVAVMQIDNGATFGHCVVALNENELVDPARGMVVDYDHDHPEVWYATIREK